MSINDIDLMAYALDELSESERRTIEEKLKSNPALQKEYQEIQSSLEIVAMSCEPIQPSFALKQRLFDTLASSNPVTSYIKRFMDLFDLDKLAAENIFENITDSARQAFYSCGIPNVSLFYFNGGKRVAHNTCGIVRIKAGKIFPAHEHTGKEHILVLQGQALDTDGQKYYPGDVVFSDVGSSHAIRVTSDDDLIFAVTLEKSNKWLIGKIIMDYIWPNKRFKNS